jgi:uncharacterized protein YqiB (DUF1249 family)
VIDKETGEIKSLVVVDEYGGEYSINEAYRPIAEHLKEKFEELEHVPVDSILFIDRQETKQKRANKTVCAQVSKVPTRFQAIIYQLTGYTFTFMIEVFKANTAYMTRPQIVALLYHEMRHIQLVVTDSGADIKIVGHDIEDWTQMVEKLGVNWNSEKQQIPNLLDNSITDWDSIEGPQMLFSEMNLRLVK